MKLTDNSPKQITSLNRRSILTGIFGCSALAALAHKDWIKPAINRIVTPAHGQAASITAGTYRFINPEIFPTVGGVGSTCIAVGFSEFDWPGGTGPFTISYRLADVTTAGACDQDDIDALVNTFESLQFTVQVVSDVGDNPLALPATTPALPSGLVFAIVIPG